MRVLIACEYSGAVRDAFTARGHFALSCDLIPTESPGHHWECDALDLIRNFSWDMLIAFPPCTYLCSSGLHRNKNSPVRQQYTELALEFVSELLSAPVEKIALENPVGCISTRIRKPDQIIQPFQFGHPESKATCLWLKNLPLLAHTHVLQKPASGRWANRTAGGQDNTSRTKDRAKNRSRTYIGIAAAMAKQWG